MVCGGDKTGAPDVVPHLGAWTKMPTIESLWPIYEPKASFRLVLRLGIPVAIVGSVNERQIRSIGVRKETFRTVAIIAIAGLQEAGAGPVAAV
ncbi:hypothetical protein NUTIK01_07140 [Novosphingobium sp. IK01]|uniref:Uncharacterized protein n=1 Tax=Novosphingobium pituita TaxID=3056842 RepID=A0ABQ6P6E3_9SPHN|nr:hypothetical protein NUTIK01_07140 [Novosphingobium sp. IK01]